MKTKKGFNLRNVCGEHIIVAEGVDNIDYSRIISLNESAAFLWKNIQGKDFNIDDLTAMMLEEYDIDEATAKADIESLVKQWEEAGIIE